MSTQALGESTENFKNSTLDAEKEGSLEGKQVVDAKKGSNKGWYILAIVVSGVVMVGAISFGTVGLLQSHGLINLPQSFDWLKSAIEAAGNTPHYWSLWVMTGGGALIGVTVIGISSPQIHKIRMAEAQEEDRRNQWAMFGDHFKTLGVDPDKYSILPEGHFTPRGFLTENKDGDLISENRPDSFFIVLKTQDGRLLCTDRIEKTTEEALGNFLITETYTHVDLPKFYWEMLGDNFKTINDNPDDYVDLPIGHSMKQQLEQPDENGDWIPLAKQDRFFVVFRNMEGNLLCTKLIDEMSADAIFQFLSGSSA